MILIGYGPDFFVQIVPYFFKDFAGVASLTEPSVVVFFICLSFIKTKKAEKLDVFENKQDEGAEDPELLVHMVKDFFISFLIFVSCQLSFVQKHLYIPLSSSYFVSRVGLSVFLSFYFFWQVS